jgi:hypothetical protein
MVYNANIPQSTDRPSSSQSQLLGNFEALATFLNNNHVNISNPVGDPEEGKHKFLQMPEQSSAPTTAANEGALYTKESSLTSSAELFYRRESSGAEIEFTSALAAQNGWTRLPSGILLKWGFTSKSGQQNVIFPTGANIPVFSNIFNVIVSVTDPSGPGAANTFVYVKTGSLTPTQFTVTCTLRSSTGSATASFHYLAIGN